MIETTKKELFTPRERLISILPAVAANLIILLLIVGTTLLNNPPSNPVARFFLYFYAIAGSAYHIVFYNIIVSATRLQNVYAWINAVVRASMIGFLPLFIPEEMSGTVCALIAAASILASLTSDRRQSYLLLGGATVISAIIRFPQLTQISHWIKFSAMTILALVSVEAIQKLKSLTRQHLNRLEIVNEFSRKIASSLETEEVLSLLNTAIQDALEADSYFVGMAEGDEIYSNLYYDDGEYFTDVRTKMDGALSGWVIKNQKELFLPDLRQEAQLEGVRIVIIGKEKISLSWMGVPMRGEFVNGVLSIASYRPNAFDRSDMELLSNLAQHATLALDNAIHHEKVEEQTRLDSLTKVYNHGYFLKQLGQQAEMALELNQPLSVIMLDVDFFKQYNDRYGHLTGDDILTKLCLTIREHIHESDAIGRWGGEEFVISLPNSTGADAMRVAIRIRETMASMQLTNTNGETILAPTVSQGIAEFPTESNDVFKLIDLADSRLYIAKARGRNQVEPDAGHWERGHERMKDEGLP